MTRADLLRSDTADDHPDRWRSGDLSLPLTYRFQPGAADDGVTVHVPVGVLTRLGGESFAWQVPALRAELLTALIKSLPKDLRRNFVPAPDTARALLPVIGTDDGPLLESVQRALQRSSGMLIPIDAFDLSKIPDHLKLTFAVEDAEGREVGRGKDLDTLQRTLAAPARQAVAAAAGGLERSGLTQWPDDLPELPQTVERTVGANTVRGYPAFLDAGASVSIRVYAAAAEQRTAMGPGIRRLIRLTAPSPVKALERQLDPRTRLILGNNPDGSLNALLEDCADAAVDLLVKAPVWTRSGFESLRGQVGDRLPAVAADILHRAVRVVEAAQQVQVALPDPVPSAQADAVADIHDQLAQPLAPGFVTRAGAGHLADLQRYLIAIERRLQRLPRDIAGDRDRMARVHSVQDAYDDLLAAVSPARRGAADIADIAWQIEEFRVSLWAQQLGTPRPVSEQRIFRAIDAVQV